VTQTLPQALAAFRPGLPLAVAYSGGADSTALLLACAQRWPGQVRAIHVHHGLQPAADGFAQHCQAQCARWAVPLRVLHVQAQPAPGESPEDAARKARYRALTQAAQSEWELDPAGSGGPVQQNLAPVRDVAVAQHADDQVETILLALSRGAGLPGLAAMPAHWQRAGLTWHRPLLAVPGAALRTWLHARGESWVEDPTNADPHYTRNRIRTQLLPVLAAAFPQFHDTLPRSAAHAAQAQTLLTEVAEQDLLVLGLPPRIALLRTLTQARQANVLRHWLRMAYGTSASAAQLGELLRQVAACTTRGHQLRLKVGTGYVLRQGDVLHWQPA
jgi:tRNA(Ile)-lysidine synthase